LFTAGNLRFAPGCQIDSALLMAMPRFEVLRDGGFVKQIPASLVNKSVRPQEIAPTPPDNRPVRPEYAAPCGDLVKQLGETIRLTRKENGCSTQKAVEAIKYDTRGGGSALWAGAVRA